MDYLLKFIPVVVIGPNGKKRTLAFFDEGLTVSLISKELAESLGLIPYQASLSLTGLNNTKLAVNINSKTNFSIKTCTDDINSQTHFVKGVFIVSELNIRAQSLKLSDLARHPHLNDLNILTYDYSLPQILLGQDQWSLIVTRDLRSSNKNALAASSTLLGWVAHGSLPRTHAYPYSSVHAVHQSIEERNSYRELDLLIKE